LARTRPRSGPEVSACPQRFGSISWFAATTLCWFDVARATGARKPGSSDSGRARVSAADWNEMYTR